ncbi:MAG: cobalamin-dependent protein, partial [Proteobacteria bacterium]|nr:cobalamin-dependent protein [Pseudomonadota bacterium]
ALTAGGESGEGNLLALTIAAARARATVGEMASALEKPFSRHVADIRIISGVYSGEVGEKSNLLGDIRARIEAFAEAQGRRPRLLVAKIGQDGHDRGQKVVASAYSDFGFDVDLGPLFQTPEEVARLAVENNVHIIGVSSLAAGHMTLVPELKKALQQMGRDDIVVIVGGVIPPGDIEPLKKAGAEAIFPPGTVIYEAASSLLDLIGTKLGHNAGAAFRP